MDQLGQLRRILCTVIGRDHYHEVFRSITSMLSRMVALDVCWTLLNPLNVAHWHGGAVEFHQVGEYIEAQQSQQEIFPTIL